MLIPRAGEHLGDFELIRRIGAGGMGVVYEARQLSTGRQVALKILSPAMTREKNRVRFLREAEAAARLHHPHIAAVYAIREDAELCYYAMEYIDGWPLSRVIEQLGMAPPSSLGTIHPVPLSEFMRTQADRNGGCDSMAETVIEGPGVSTGGPAAGPADRAEGAGEPPASPLKPTFSQEGEGDGPEDRPSRGPSNVFSRPLIGDESYVRQVVTMIRDTARALQYAHSQGVTHRDIKPDNLLMDQEGELHLVDFGLARVLEEDNLTITGELMGTPLYMSPEQVAAGRIGIDHRTDLYSLGVVLYHLLCLQPPYEAPTREALLRAIVIHSPPPLSSRNPAVPRELERIVHHAMEKDPDRRYASGAELADDLDRWLAGQPISLRLPGPLARWWGGVSRSGRRALAGVTTAVLALAAVLAAVALRDGGEPASITSPQPAEALQRATREAAAGDYFQSALWYAEAFRRGARPEDIPVLRPSIVFNELAPYYARYRMSPVERPWSLHPASALCALVEASGGARLWDLAGGPALGPAVGPDPLAQRLSFDPDGQTLWSVRTDEEGDLLQLWTPTGQPLASEPMRVAGRITRVRTAFTRSAGGGQYTVLVLFRPAAADAVPPRGRNLLGAAVYRFRPGEAPVSIRQMSNVRLADLSHTGRWLAALTGDDLFQTILLTRASAIPVGPAGTTALFACSPTVDEMALADPRGDISFKEPRQPTRPVGFAPESSALRPGTTPAYLRFSSDGKYLLVVGTDTEVIPPHRRSVIVINTRSAAEIRKVFARDACFSADGRNVVWWDDEAVTFAACEENEARIRSQIRVPVRNRAGAATGAADADPADTRHLPVQIDAQARRMVCIESDGPEAPVARVSAWDVETGERLRILHVSPAVSACGLDATGRFAFVEMGPPDPELLAWDLGGPEAPYPRSAALPVLPASLDDLRLTREPLVAVLSQSDGGLQWSLLDPATLQPAVSPSASEGSTAAWLISDDASVLVQVMGGGMRRVDLRSGRWSPILPLAESPESVLALSPDGQKVAIAHDYRLVLHAAETGAAELELPPFTRRPTRARFSPGGGYIAVADRSDRITVHALAPPGQIMEVNTGRPVRQMEFCFADTLLVVGHTAGAASLWSVPEGRCIGRVEPTSRPELPTLVAVRDRPVGAAPSLLATACANRIELRPLPRPFDHEGEARLDPIGPPLETTDGILALAFPPCDADPPAGGSAAQAASSAGAQAAAEDTPQPCERLLVLTDSPAVRWFDLAAHSWTPEQWQREVAARTGMAIDAEGQPARLPR